MISMISFVFSVVVCVDLGELAGLTAEAWQGQVLCVTNSIMMLVLFLRT